MKANKRLFTTAFVYLIAALAGGVFYREFTKFSGFSGHTTLAVLHTHLFLLGMAVFLLMLLLEGQFRVTERKSFRILYWIYNAGIVVTAGAFVWRGVTQVLSAPNRDPHVLLTVLLAPVSSGMDAAISGVAGIGHILIATGLIWYFVLLKKQLAAKAAG